MKSRPLSGATLVTSPVIVWRPIRVASDATCADGCGGGGEALCATARPTSSKPAVVPASIAGSFMAFLSFFLVDQRQADQRTCQPEFLYRDDRKRCTWDLQTQSTVFVGLCVASRRN